MLIELSFLSWVFLERFIIKHHCDLVPITKVTLTAIRLATDVSVAMISCKSLAFIVITVRSHNLLGFWKEFRFFLVCRCLITPCIIYRRLFAPWLFCRRLILELGLNLRHLYLELSILHLQNFRHLCLELRILHQHNTHLFFLVASDSCCNYRLLVCRDWSANQDWLTNCKLLRWSGSHFRQLHL